MAARPTAAAERSSAADTKDGIALTVTAKDDAATKEIRAQARASADAAYIQLDPDKQKADWNKALAAYFAAPTGDDYRTGGFPMIPLFIRPNFLATVTGLTGPALNSTEYFTWNVETWVATAK